MKFKTAELAAEQIQKQRVIKYKKVFGSKDGREILADLIDRNYVLNTTGGDPLKEGRRACVLDIIHLTKLDLRAFDELLTNHEGE